MTIIDVVSGLRSDPLRKGAQRSTWDRFSYGYIVVGSSSDTLSLRSPDGTRSVAWYPLASDLAANDWVVFDAIPPASPGGLNAGRSAGK